ncbi:MAG: hypothetical protein ACTSV3_01235 [Candidatus Thorarchaeota archaeon]|nr:MAG: hypothetical protein DRP09_07850 [Candidatus Thorarchaeota archaeon]
MVIRLKDAIVESIQETETRRLKLLKLSSRSEGASISVELPDALSSTIAPNEPIGVIIDSKPIPKGESARLYVEGSVFKRSEDNGLRVVGSIGGLRIVIDLAKATASQINTFASEKFYMVLK